MDFSILSLISVHEALKFFTFVHFGSSHPNEQNFFVHFGLFEKVEKVENGNKRSKPSAKLFPVDISPSPIFQELHNAYLGLTRLPYAPKL